jgi:hypothetical protein
MEKSRGALIVGASVALLVSAGALTYLMRRRGDLCEGTSEPEPVKRPKVKTKKPARKVHARNGKVSHPA